MNKNLFYFALSLMLFSLLLTACKKDVQVSGLSTQTQQNTKLYFAKWKKQLVTGLGGGWGSTIGPSGDLFVPDGIAGEIVRINPRTGAHMIFASGLPKMIPEVGIGGISDVAFYSGKAYALVTLVDDPTLFPTGQVNGIYRIDGPNSFTVIADIGAFNLAHPPTGFNFDVSTGVTYSMQKYRGGFLVTDGHLNRVLYISLNGEITILKKFGNIVPTGLEVAGNRIYMSEAGPVPHLPENGKIVSFSEHGPWIRTVASGAPLMVDVEFGRGQEIFGLSQGLYSGNPEGSPALPNTGSLVKVKADGTFRIIATEIDRPTSLEIIGNTAYIITLGGDVWTVSNISGPPFGRCHKSHFYHRHH